MRELQRQEWDILKLSKVDYGFYTESFERGLKSRKGLPVKAIHPAGCDATREVNRHVM